jgi:long-subunit fatty acid transport protein
MKMNKVKIVLGVIALASSCMAFGAGFEKSVFWSGHYAAIAGAAQSSVTGPESLYWNPAGLAGSEGLQVSGDFSPTWAMYSGPMSLSTPGGTVGTAQDSNTTFSPVGAGFVSYGISPQWGVGIGYYVTGGTRADYDSVPSTALGAAGISYAPPLKADLTLTELSAGTGYEVLPGLKLGAAYRVMFVHATLDAAGAITSPAVALISTQISGISQTAWSGIRFGLEYEPKGSPWGFGVTYRNQVRFNAPGSANVTVAAPGLGIAGTGVSEGASENVIVSGQLPQSINAAAHYQFNPAWTGFLGYTFTNYAQEQSLGVSGVTAGPLGLLADSSTAVPLSWTNLHNVRVAGEYTGFQDWAFRAGYVWTSQVTATTAALPILASPGTGNTVVAGAGHQCMPHLTLDGAFEYSWDSGTVGATPTPLASTAQGPYTAKAYAVHLSANYVF